MPKEIPWPENRPSPSALQAPADAETAQPLERRHRVRLADQLYGQIFEQLVSGNLSVGDKLPSENEISERYGVSRPVVRGAAAPAPTGWSRRIRGWAPRQPPARAQAQDLQRRGARQRLSARAGGAGGAGRRCRAAALRRTDEQLRKIEAHQAFAESLAQGACRPRPIWRSTPASPASGNDFYLGVLESIHDSISGFMRLTLSLTRTGSRQRAQTVDEHATILAAIRAQDSEHARVAMQFHLGRRAPAGGPRD